MDKILKEFFLEGVKAADPYFLVKKNFKIVKEKLKEYKLKKIVIFSFGKAAYQMAKPAIEELGGHEVKGVVITKYGYIPKKEKKSNLQKKNFNKLKIIEAGHPLPDLNGLNGTKKILEMIEKEKTKSLFLNLISGGGSSLLTSPKMGITLKEKIKTTEILLKAGADIYELNCVRKHLSNVKGGNLSRFTYPSPSISFIISDVIGDNLDVIASGPTYPDCTTFKEALSILEKYKISKKVPESVLNILKNGAQGKLPENPKTHDKIFEKVQNVIIGNNSISIKKICELAKRKGFDYKIISSELKGEAKITGKYLAEIAIEEKKNLKKPLLLIAGGEITVKVKGNGMGGRAQELALSFALNIKGQNGIYLLSAGTDGTDGPTDAAGAFVSSNTLKMAKKIGVDPEIYLNNNDSYNFFKKVNGLFMTGPTGTNVMDLYLILIK